MPLSTVIDTWQTAALSDQGRGDPAHQILEALNEAACSFQSGGPQLDDMTAVVCKVEG